MLGVIATINRRAGTYRDGRGDNSTIIEGDFEERDDGSDHRPDHHSDNEDNRLP